MSKTRLENQVGSGIQRKIFTRSPVGFCLIEIPLSMMLSKTKGCMMGEPGQRNVKLTHNLFIVDLVIALKK